MPSQAIETFFPAVSRNGQHKDVNMKTIEVPQLVRTL